ncbi:MAG: ABC transporter permease [Bacilli bacterium]|nr:ABC transporter permease [Bacilli bacterium]MBN2876880.1 ABC transporter permease [Bacilli bacterium]
MNRLGKFSKTDAGESILSSILAIIAGVMFGFLLMLIFVPSDAFGGLWIIISGAFQKGNESFGNFLMYAAPIIVTGLSVGFAFKTGLFNIGATGQFTVGAFAAVFVGVRWTFLPDGMHWMVAVLAAIFAGAVWGLIPGLLKAFFNVHEVVSTIMLNYTAMYLVILGVKTYVYNSLYSESASVVSEAVIPKMGLNLIFPDSSINGGFFLAVLAVIVIYIVLKKTTFGYQLKAVGYNKDAAKYAGVNEKISTVYSMTIAGALSGLAGAIVFLTKAGAHISTTYSLMSQGFDGIAVALLGLSHPLGILASGLFFGYIKNSGFYLQSLSFSKEVIGIIVATIIYFSALSMLFRNLVKKIFAKHVEDVKGDDQ